MPYSRTEEDFEILFSALQAIATAQGMSNVADKAGVTRDALYKAFTKHNNPKIESFRRILNSLGFDLAIRRLAQ